MFNVKTTALAFTLALGTALSAWAPNATAQRYYYDERDREYAYSCHSCGTVTRVEPVWTRDRRVGGGTVLGAIIGGAVGNQVGSGSGRKAATVAGAIAGGAIGHNVEKNRRADVRGYLITVRMDRGGYRTVETPYDYDIGRGDRVRVSSNGRLRPLY